MGNFLQQTIPVADWVESFTEWLTGTFSGLFSALQSFGQLIMDTITNVLLFVPPLVLIVLLTIAAFMVSGKKWGLTAFTFVGLLFIYNQGLWTDLMNTVTLVLLSSLVSIIIGIPLGILMAKSEKAQSIVTPILDFMQTMPGFVYLIPAVAFFGIGMVPGVFASVIFALPPTVRMTNLGIRQISRELVEASDSFGGTGWQKLIKLELPLAKSTILAGVNQTTMLALSMVVIASMIGAPGLGRGVLSALQRAQVGNGFVSGVSLVILAIIMDRFTQNLNKPAHKKQAATVKNRKQKRLFGGIAAVAVVALIGASVAFGNVSDNKGTVNLAYVEWDTEVASTHVVAAVLTEMGYEVKTTPLDNAIMWESVAKGEVDGMVAAWLPSTHEAQYEQYKDQVENLGPNLEGAKLGIVVPSYMDVDSIADLSDEAGKTITGIEPGAGVVSAAENTVATYDNLSDWEVATSSSGAMTVALGQAIKNQEDIVITGWSPHWMFAKYDLKYLDDPEGTMGDAESINTMVRQGLSEDMPEVYDVLDKFSWTQEDMEEVMLAINDGASAEDAAKDWVDNHAEEVAAWTNQ
ncbi:ABC transporter permease/substrate binding protein [Enterococcus sp. RIT-PI-f]|uniref:ABC transporter permease/substrate binding protein n=1 Tax=Enterococcus sp. RIT-PI-f TaxID=1690244 RepID=UPI0006B9A5E5|nr:ABC transporter permease/substrate binding protein [Enterococcus sp. RIT-PI-f]KPG71219.1 glycine/betaine ABC transporter permease [Enterococcus sp. RIT-PI-f]